jgi:hypothetical protein
MRTLLVAVALAPLAIATMARAQTTPATPVCATTPLDSVNVAGLQKDADCFAAVEAQAKTEKQLRLDRLDYLKAHPPTFSANDVTVNEDAGTVSVVITRANANGYDSKVNWRITGGTATAGLDYTNGSGGFAWPASWGGSMTITFPILKDQLVEPDETVNITLTAETNAIIGHQPTVTIKDVPPPVVVPPDGILSPGISGLPDVPSEFDPATLLKPFGIPPSMGSDPLGAFRFICGAGPLKYDDPIVFPNQPGHSHLHQFSGNITVDANSTYESLRKKGDGTCGGTNQGKTLNRSAYWHPAMLDGRGNVVQPDDYGIYYKRIPEGTPNCDPASPKFQGICVDLPNGLRMVVGSNFKGGWKQPHTPPQTPYVGAFRFNCVTANGNGIAGVSGQYFDIASVPKCEVGNQFSMTLQFPPCWDGIHLDAADHGSHMDYMTNGKCDAKHPYLIPTFLFSMGWKVQPGDDTTLWSLSSDDIDKTKPHGWSIHADWFGAWDPDANHKRWYPHCINGHLSGTGGSFCDGTSFDAGSPWHLKPDGTLVKTWTNPVHLVPIPPLPVPMGGMTH